MLLCANTHYNDFVSLLWFKVSQALITSIDTAEKKKNPYDDAQGTEIGEHKLGQEKIKKKRASFVYTMIQRLVKKIHQSSSISRTW